MRLRTRRPASLTLNTDKKQSPLSEADKLNNLNEDKAIIRCLEILYKYRDIEPLIIEFNEKNAGIFRNHEAMKLIEKMMSGNLALGKGRVTSLKTRRRDYYICRSIYHLKNTGLPIKADEDRGKDSACSITSARFSMSPGAVYNVWRTQKESSKGFNCFELPKWRFQGMPAPTHNEIVNYFYEIFLEECADNFRLVPLPEIECKCKKTCICEAISKSGLACDCETDSECECNSQCLCHDECICSYLEQWEQFQSEHVPQDEN